MCFDYFSRLFPMEMHRFDDPVADRFYRQLQAGLQYCLQDSTATEPEKLSRCFWMAVDLWKALRQAASISSREKEVHFFRTIKPVFTGTIQYITIRAEALLFIPCCQNEQSAFWAEESQRLHWFCDQHASFVNYMKSAATTHDANYFTRVPADYEPQRPLMPYDDELAFCCSRDWELRGYFAHQRYHAYCQKKLRQLKVL